VQGFLLQTCKYLAETCDENSIYCHNTNQLKVFHQTLATPATDKYCGCSGILKCGQLMKNKKAG